MAQWYYVEGKDRKGPADENEILELISSHALNEESFIWRKGFDQWQKLKGVPEFSSYIDGLKNTYEALPKTPAINWANLATDKDIFTIRVGMDRGGADQEYGPYSLNTLKQLYHDRRINAKTYVFTPGMDDWMLFGELPILNNLMGGTELSDKLDEQERRQHSRKPFVARMLFHDNEQVYEGVCRDISVGGMQILVANCPGNVGDEMSMNVHPDNSDFCFVANGEIVRMLDGKQGFSFRFKSLNGDAQRAINHYIDS